ncbi:MAG: hypothetical protein R3255_03610 [Candidatus Lokiarchaeia archaeon]|nr:hypothetical protein [Candidatus Lokiarchaeia archaeon]
MINKHFKENWIKILKFNLNRNILQEPENVKEHLRIPFTPLSINANLLYHFFEVLYPRFINDQQNILDIITTNADKKNKLQGLYLYETKKAGIHETVESLSNDLIRIKSGDIENLDVLFDKVQKAILKTKKVRISSIRLFNEEAIDLINKHCDGLEQLSVYEFLERSMRLLQDIINQNLVIIYPEPIIIKFFKASLKLLDQIRLLNLFKFVEETIPESNISIFMKGSGIKVILHLQKQLSKLGKSNLTLNILTPEELGINLSDSDMSYNLDLIQQQLKTNNSYFIKQDDVISFLLDIFELFIPLKKDNISFLLQKALFWYRSFETHWDMVPRPRIYKTFIRFIIRLFGFNLNLKKLSHWAIPEFLFNYIDISLGLNFQILCIITDQEKTKNIGKIQNIVSKGIIKYIFLLSFEESTLSNIKIIDKDELLTRNSNSLSSIQEKFASKFGFIAGVFVLDKLLLHSILKYFLLSHSKVPLFPKFKIIKMLKNEKFFKVFPEFPFYLLVKKKGPIALAKLLLPIIIDKHEF